MTGQIDPDTRLEQGIWSIVRKTLPSLRSTAIRDVKEILINDNLLKYVKIYNMGREFVCGRRMIEFFSIDDEQKVRSRKRDVLHICEANEIDFMAFTQLDLRTSVRTFLDFNPSDPYSWINTELEEKRMIDKGDVKLVESTFRDNPFLSKREVEKIEYLKDTDPQLWAIFGEGQYGKITGLIYPEFTLTKYPKETGQEYLGVDWGFSDDPAAVVKATKIGEDIYFKELVYERQLTNPMLAERIKGATPLRFGVGDSAEPKSIVELSTFGFDLAKSPKGPDSIRAGINLMKSYTIHIDPNSINLLQEIRSYKWHESSNKTVPVDRFNHALDACRYLTTKFFPRSTGFGFAGAANSYDPLTPG